MGLHMIVSLGSKVALAAMHRSIHISVTVSLPLSPCGASSRGVENGTIVKLLEEPCADPDNGFVNIRPEFLVITSASTCL